MASPWLGWLIAASIMRQAGVITGADLAAINLGLKTIPVDRRTGGAADCSGPGLEGDDGEGKVSGMGDLVAI
ncbi:hypothetical protein ACVIDN_007591 [Rhizobium brockwellii]